MTNKPKKRKAAKRAAPLSRQDLLPMAASLARSVSLKNHMALAVLKTGQGNLDLAGELLKTLYWAFYLSESREVSALEGDFMAASGFNCTRVAPDERVTVISDDAGEFGKAVDGSQLARGRILDWFHIAMKFKAAKHSVLGSQTMGPHARIAVETGIDHAKWLVWDGKGRQSVSRTKALDATSAGRLWQPTLYWNLGRLYFYIENNAGTLVNYGMRYHKGLPISSSIAKSAVNLVVSHRMAKKQQMRWTDEGAHCLAQVRVAVFNEEFSVKELAVLTKTSAAANSPSARRAA
jgi:hypothetical protein